MADDSGGLVSGATSQASIQGMTTAQQHFQEAVTKHKSLYQNMSSQIADLKASWGGEAANSYQGAMDTWLQEFSKVNAALEEMLNRLAENTHVNVKTAQVTLDAAQQTLQNMQSANVGLPNFH
ncbi:WXG100 family type VII secretion target [Streptomyces griseoluteus]|uniref:WXG100 family type VII secretion target n=1 Tax=Streptomyces griseoluteus TaxID=29306 RepID=UPI003804E070